MVPVLALVAGCTGFDFNLSDPDSGAAPRTQVEETFTQAPLPKLDVLFVVDDTGSMSEEQAAFAAAAAEFVDSLDSIGLAWQIGVVSMDPDSAGALLGEPWILTPATPDVDTAFAANVTVGTDGSATQAGLYAASAALFDQDEANLGFRRDDAPLHVVFISDGDDESDAWLGADPVTSLAAELAAEQARTGRAVRASAVVGTALDGCDGPFGSALVGSRYLDLATRTGGAEIDICSADFAEVATAVGEYGAEWPASFTLGGDPVDGTVTVDVDGERRSGGWSIDHTGPALVFDVAPVADAIIDVTYEVGGT